MSEPPETLCVLTDPYLMANEARTLTRAVEQTDIEVALVLVNDEPDPDIDPDAEASAVNGGVRDALGVLGTVIGRSRTMLAGSREYLEENYALETVVDRYTELFAETLP